MNPAPVPLDRLQGLLNKSKAVMHKADRLKPMASSSINESYDDVEVQELYEGSAVDYATSVSNSRLPDAIKKLMMDKPIAKPDQIPMTPVSENYSEDDEKPMPEMQRKRTQQAAPATNNRRPLNENTNSGAKMITISEEQLDKMINEKLLDFFKNSYDKALTEAAINRTIRTMINEGVISQKKK